MVSALHSGALGGFPELARNPMVAGTGQGAAVLSLAEPATTEERVDLTEAEGPAHGGADDVIHGFSTVDRKASPVCILPIQIS
jgi:hypothetical protein